LQLQTLRPAPTKGSKIKLSFRQNPLQKPTLQHIFSQCRSTIDTSNLSIDSRLYRSRDRDASTITRKDLENETVLLVFSSQNNSRQGKRGKKRHSIDLNSEGYIKKEAYVYVYLCTYCVICVYVTSKAICAPSQTLLNLLALPLRRITPKATETAF
jgi:hypothetical protein